MLKEYLGTCDYQIWSYGNTWAATETERPIAILKTALKKAALPNLQLQNTWAAIVKQMGIPGDQTIGVSYPTRHYKNM